VRYAFADCKIDLARHELFRAEELVHVEPQVFDLLAHLVVNAERVVPKGELLDEVWGSRFVTESALTSRVKSARKAVGDDGDAQAVIRTVRGKGFRLIAPVRVVEALAENAPGPRVELAGTPTLETVPRGQTTWPSSITEFVGRARERADLAAALERHRLVTVLGPGGMGKTRLSIQVMADVAAAYRDGVWFVDLAQVNEAQTVPMVVARALGVPERYAGSWEDGLAARIGDGRALVVLDNCEHLLDGVRPFLDRLLARCPEVQVMATSRTRLMTAYEHVYELPGLSVTNDGGDAVDLFVARSRPGAPDAGGLDRARVATLCTALDGVALAIELAAARYPTLGLDGLESGLDQRLRLLAAPSPVARHRSLRGAIEWSHDLLTETERTLLRRVAVLQGRFDVRAACEVAALSDVTEAADGLGRLADHSLLVAELGDPTRYRALESIRQFGLEQLALTEELEPTHARHHVWCGNELALLADQVRTDDGWCARLDDLLEGLRAALHWLAQRPERGQVAAGFAMDLAQALCRRGRTTEAGQRYEQAAELDPSHAAHPLQEAGWVAASAFRGNAALLGP
jgi:predicted ATPase/DNA-binding winged helix-turn-helix (wHTH) protein